VQRHIFNHQMVLTVFNTAFTAAAQRRCFCWLSPLHILATAAERALHSRPTAFWTDKRKFRVYQGQVSCRALSRLLLKWSRNVATCTTRVKMWSVSGNICRKAFVGLHTRSWIIHCQKLLTTFGTRQCGSSFDESKMVGSETLFKIIHGRLSQNDTIKHD